MSCRHVLRCSMVYNVHAGFSSYRGNIHAVRCGCKAGFRFLLPFTAHRLYAGGPFALALLPYARTREVKPLTIVKG
jgi:hypothetical protein